MTASLPGSCRKPHSGFAATALRFSSFGTIRFFFRAPVSSATSGNGSLKAQHVSWSSSFFMFEPHFFDNVLNHMSSLHSSSSGFKDATYLFTASETRRGGPSYAANVRGLEGSPTGSGHGGSD